MKTLPAIIVGVVIYLAIHFGEKGVHYIYFNLTHDFGTNNILMMLFALMLSFATLLGGGVAGYLSQRGFFAGFIVGLIAGLMVLIVQQMTGANPLLQEYTPTILFEEVFLLACVCAAAGAAGELIKRKSS